MRGVAPRANVVDGLIVKHKVDIGVLQKGVGAEHGVVRLNHGRGDERGGVHGKGKLGFLWPVLCQSLKQKGCQAGTRPTTDGVVQEAASNS